MSSQPTEHIQIEEDSGELVPVQKLHAQLQTVQSQLQKDFVLLVANLVDDSGSIEAYRNTEAVINGHNALIERLRSATTQIRVMTRMLTAGILFNYCRPKDAALLNNENYRPVHGTPFYHEGTQFLARVLRTTNKLRENGRKVFTFNTIFSDGEDTEPGKYTSEDAKRIVQQMLEAKNHIIAAVGVEGNVDPYDIFRKMGIPEEWILIVKRTNPDIERGFRDASDQTMDSSMSEADFMRASATGFRQRRRKP